MSFKNKYTDCSGKEFFTNDEPYMDKTLYHVVAEDEYGVNYRLSFQSVLNEEGKMTHDKIPVSAKPISELNVFVKERMGANLSLSDGSVLTLEMKKKDFWIRENKKYIPIYSHFNFGNDTLVEGFIVRLLKLRDFIEIADERSLMRGYGL